jgi:hypothetical protein
MPYATIDKPNLHFTAYLRNGVYAVSGTTNFTTDFQPDLSIMKVRSTTGANDWTDAVRGANKQIKSNTTGAEQSVSAVTAFLSNGFTITNENDWGSGDTVVHWLFKANGAGSSNTAGSISSTVSANTTSGFSIVSYTGNGSNSTVGHGLGVAPAFIIFKNRSSGTGWACYNKNIGASKYLALNETIEAQTATGVSNSTDPTSSVFSIGTADRVNTNGNNYIAYCFAEVKGFSKAFSYTGNGSTDGSFIYCGFLPSFVLLKRTDSAGFNWVIHDNKRDINNPDSAYLHPNTSGSESTDRDIDLLSNGFKMRNSNTTWNASGGTYIGIAFAENPFVSSKGIPTTAR